MASGPLVPFKLFYGEVASGTGDATITDLPFTPDFVVATPSNAAGEIGWSASGSTLTLNRSNTTATGISYIAGLASA